MLEAEDFLARVIQHELDHLQGILFTSKVVRYVKSGRVRQRSGIRMTKIVFMGTPDFAVPVLKQLISDGYEVVAVVTQPDRPVGRKKILTPPPVKVAAEQHRNPVFATGKVA